jgi:hypothetical protein
MYGLGNDFIVLDARKDPEISSAAEPKRATRLTDRKMGIVRIHSVLCVFLVICRHASLVAAVEQQAYRDSLPLA